MLGFGGFVFSSIARRWRIRYKPSEWNGFESVRLYGVFRHVSEANDWHSPVPREKSELPSRSSPDRLRTALCGWLAVSFRRDEKWRTGDPNASDGPWVTADEHRTAVPNTTDGACPAPASAVRRQLSSTRRCLSSSRPRVKQPSGRSDARSTSPRSRSSTSPSGTRRRRR